MSWTSLGSLNFVASRRSWTARVPPALTRHRVRTLAAARVLAAAPLLQRHLPRYHPDRQASNGAFKRAILDVAGGVEFLLALGWRVKVSCRPQPNVMPML